MGRNKSYFEFYDGDELIGIFTAKEIRECTDCGVKNVHRYASTGSAYRKRWRFVAVDDAENFMTEWEKARKRILEA